MAILIPSIHRCTFDNAGDRLLAERLVLALGDQDRVWHRAAVGPKQTQAGFVVLSPQRGLLLLETRDWKTDEIERATPQAFVLSTGEVSTLHINPLAQARHCSIQIASALERDASLLCTGEDGPGPLDLAMGHGVVLTGITRQQFNSAGLDQALEAQLVVCQDELIDASPTGLAQCLWGMVRLPAQGQLSLQRIDRILWNMFPAVRLPVRGALFALRDPQAAPPDTAAVLNLDQEHVVRAPLLGPQLLMGVAGSGKTTLLAYRAQQLARASAASSKPILVLCMSEPLSVTLRADIEANGLASKVQVRYFHNWCYRQLSTYGLPLPLPGEATPSNLVQRVLQAVERRRIPKGQYQAVLIDEGHDFAPEWLKLVGQMVDPATQRLLIAFDSSQATPTEEQLQALGIPAHDEPMVLPKAYRDAGASVLIDEGTLRDEAFAIAHHLHQAQQQGQNWGNMAMLCADAATLNLCAHTLATLKLPYKVRRKPGDYQPGADSIQVMTIAASKGLEFELVAIPGVGHWPSPDHDEKDAERMLQIATDRAMQALVIGVSGTSAFAKALRNAAAI